MKKILLLSIIMLVCLCGVSQRGGVFRGNKEREKQQKEFDHFGPEMVFIKGGRFQMGSNNGDSDEKPVHSVRVSDFWMGKYEVTNEEYCAFLNDYGSDKVKSGDYSGESMMYFSGSWKGEKCRIYKRGSSYKVESGYGKYPVIYVTWYGANEYCKWLSGKTGKSYRLPTEAEWEYAAGNGSKHTKYSWGNNFPSGKRGGNVADETAKREFSDWTIFEGYTDGYVYVAPVGKFYSNDFGLYDMTGNVWEWCSDWYGAYSSSSQSDPQGPSSGSIRVDRGGGWGSYASYCRVADRFSINPTGSIGDMGFRVASRF
ncbi:MAG: hypothetical protein CSA05_02970 [Bacteroidia bacterium]|nr:MAG: hypothetical protein CSA05_02970 [Bacteroidia bacterium]